MPTLVQVTLQTVDAIPENFITNNFAVAGNVDPSTEGAGVMAAFAAFYNGIRSTVYPGTIAQNGHFFKLYIAGGAKPNYPIYESTFNFSSAPSGTQLPSECAVCLSFQGIRTPGLPQARRRGRVYLGPCKDTMNTSGRPTAANLTTILGAAQTLATAIRGISGAEDWAVWSPSDGTAVVLDNAWMDNAWDTQRSRGLIRTLKQTVPL